MANYSELTDHELTILLKMDDQAAFAEIFSRYNSILFIHADNKLRNPDEARDMVQDIFVKLWEKRSVLSVSSNLLGYLYIALRNHIFNLIKHKKIIKGYADSFYGIDAETNIFTDYLIREKQFAAMIEKEVNSLPQRMREVFELRRFKNLSNKEVASMLSIKESTAADQMKKALRLLKERISYILILASIADKMN
jgi:RNA polymerase sigma-70 factor (ECF subfamily)